MELIRNENEKLERLVKEWLPQEKRELEATFGAGGHLDQTSFLAVAQRLKAKGYEALPSVDYLTITIKDSKSDVNVRRDTLTNNTRFTIVGNDNVERYCNQESLDGLTYEVILKTPIGSANEDTLDLQDYEMRFKVRRENERSKNDAVVTEILSQWPEKMKAFRLIRRWTFKGDGCVFDLSMVRSNRKNESGAYIVTKTFSDSNYSILNEPPTYEVEVELKHSTEITTVDAAMKKLIKGVGEVLRGIQRNSVLIRKSKKKQTLDSYFQLANTNEFRGVKPRTLEMKNFIEKPIPNTPNIRDGYNVTDKADGLRVLGYCDSKGELFMIDKALNVYRTGFQNEKCKNSLVDGEWITTIKDEADPIIQKATQQLWLFDIYIAAEKKVVDALPFYSSTPEAPSRYKELLAWHTNWSSDGPNALVAGVRQSNGLLVKVKTFEFGLDRKEALRRWQELPKEKQKGSARSVEQQAGKDIFAKAKKMLDRKTEYNTDGLIFTSNSAPLPPADTNFKEQFKWKPAEDNTIDFLVRIEKDETTGEDLVQTNVHPSTGKLVTYKTLLLKVGSTMDPACSNPRDTILNEKPLPKGGCRADRFSKDRSGKYRAVLFNPGEYANAMASICKVEIERDPDTQLAYVKTEKSEQPIEDKSIIEMRYDMTRPEGWRWVPVRVRVDKTEKLQRGELTGTLNADITAESVWKSIHNPITKGMITTGNEAPLESELEETEEDGMNTGKAYFERRANKEQLQSVEGLRNFHKHYVKGEMLLQPTLQGGDSIVLDLAVGEAADINRWISNKASFVYGMDIAAKGILDSHRGAYAKYMNRLTENELVLAENRVEIPPMIFGIGDVSKSLATGEAGANDEESNILRSVFGKVAPMSSVPPFVEHKGKDALKEGANVISCMFALHYFFKDKNTFKGFLNNINQNLKVNGYFVACFFDGQKVFDLLKPKKEGESVTGMQQQTAIWRITKQYTSSTLPSDDTGFGLAIQNKFISIGTEHKEYLVSFELLEKSMREIGCKLLSKEDLQKLGLPASTETFDVSYRRVSEDQKRAGKTVYPMSETVKKYSFLNRWCIFKRYSGTTMEEEEEEIANVPSQAATVVAAATVGAKRPQTLAWQDVPKSGTSSGSNAAAEVVREVTPAITLPGTATSALTTATAAPGKALPASLGTAMITGVTVPVQPPEQEYEDGKIFAFSPSEENSTLLEQYPDAPKYLAPSTPFVIIDKEDSVSYPSILHYLGAMEYKVATNKPGLGPNTFGVNGTIHQDFLRKGLPHKADKGKQEKLLQQEAKKVLEVSESIKFQKDGLQYDDVKWTDEIRDKYLKLAYGERFEKDQNFRKILEELRKKEMYLLYRPTSTKVTTNLGGILKVVRRNKKRMVKVEGGNRLGILLMQLAGFPGYQKIEASSKEDDDE